MTWLAYFVLLANLSVPVPQGCERKPLEQGSGTVLVCKAGVL